MVLGDLAKLILVHQHTFLKSSDEIENAYLYWAGSGFGDFEVKLNDQDIIAQRTFQEVTKVRQGFLFQRFCRYNGTS
jgi:hypothetical protein